MLDEMNNIKTLADNLDQPTLICPRCGTVHVDRGQTLIECCGQVLQYREPVNDYWCDICHKYHAGQCVDDEQEHD